MLFLKNHLNSQEIQNLNFENLYKLEIDFIVSINQNIEDKKNYDLIINLIKNIQSCKINCFKFFNYFKEKKDEIQNNDKKRLNF